MPLLDHFSPPLFPPKSWESFLLTWAAGMVGYLNERLPQQFIAEVQPRLGRHAERDIEESGLEPGGATIVVPTVFPDNIEVRVRDEYDCSQLRAVVLLATPVNKAHPAARRAFAAKCVTYLSQGVGLVAVDIVTTYRTSLHNALIDLMGCDSAFQSGEDLSLSATAYRPARRQERNLIDVWLNSLAIGGDLPRLPLALRGAGCLPLDLDTSYAETCRRNRL
jgi:hypothetical protein